jgi:hypothetical protein
MTVIGVKDQHMALWSIQVMSACRMCPERRKNQQTPILLVICQSANIKKVSLAELDKAQL